MQFQSELLEPVQCEDRHVGAGGGVERDALARPVHRLGDRFPIRPGRHKAAAKDVELRPTAPTPAHPLLDPRQRDLGQIAARAERVQAHSVANLAGDPQHRLADGGDRDRHHRQRGRLRREVGGHQGQLKVLALVIELPARLPALPDRAQRPDVIAQPGCRWAPGNPEPTLVVAFDLAA